jgi:hypothetical protein
MLGNLSTRQMTGVPVHLAPLNKTERKIPRGPLKNMLDSICSDGLAYYPGVFELKVPYSL